MMPAEVRRWAVDPVACASRHAVAIELASALCTAGEEIRVVGHLLGDDQVTGSSPRGNGNDSLVAIGYVAGAAGELLRGAEGSVRVGQLYVAAALFRQLVEFEYLTWAFETAHDDAAIWLNSSADERRRMWRPRHLRERADGRFQWRDYSTHCERGGHPTPEGLRAFLNDRDGASGAVVLVDSLNHASRIWRSVTTFAQEASRVDVDALGRSLERWHAKDGLRSSMANGMTVEGLS